jgi:putative membrane protein
VLRSIEHHTTGLLLFECVSYNPDSYVYLSVGLEIMKSPRQILGIYARGFCMGAADAVPGVSGGTIVLLTEIYERLIAAITAITVSRVRRLVREARDGNRPGVARTRREMDIWFLAVLGTGVMTAVVSVQRIISRLLSVSPVEVYGFFFGLIGASALVLYRDVSLATRGERAAVVAGFVVAFAGSGYAATGLDTSLPVAFLAVVIAISAMVLPGMSGSLLLLALGPHEHVSTALSRFTDALLATAQGGGVAGVYQTGIPVVTFLFGAVICLLSVAHAVRAAFERNREVTMAFLVSLIVGALRAPVEQASVEPTQMEMSWTAYWIRSFILFAIVDIAVVAAIEWGSTRVTQFEPVKEPQTES